MLEQIINQLGFVDPAGIFWNTLGYVGMLIIIIAVVSDRWRSQFFFWGPLILLFYAWTYLADFLLVGAQVIITTSGFLNLVKIKKQSLLIVLGLTVIVFLALMIAGQIVGFWDWLGLFGLLGIALGLTQVPSKKGFVIMTLAGLLMAAYAFVLQIWVFFLLNLIFVTVNLLTVTKRK